MRVTWDPAKAQKAWKERGISFADAATVLDDPLARTVEDERHGEQRWVTVGADLYGRVLVVAYTYENDGAVESIRIISARKAEPSERRSYEND